MPRGQILLLLLLTGLAGTAGQGQEWDLGGSDASVIAVPNGGPWGDWAWPEMCPKGSYASGVSFKVEAPQGVMEDDTALNGIRLHCSRGGDPSGGYTAESQSGRWGHWSEACWCPHRGRLVGFALRVQPPQRGLLSDEVAATSARFACSDGHVLEGPGSTWGQWGSWSPQCPRAVCGIQTRQEPARGLKRDDTALNDLRLFCCP
ncbi:vitelline membrane outer layer protein 1 homolog [Gymnogyps californianus]|uniref:vitelline membrane outer layer protein 1 homolog n=1 Tax=Gymnogyps californianus TaxID=33616 RepID=UPI0021C67C30|nr:vitelline membrane outer layer protein 1 homolog [Gymnogyps californianus]